MVSVSSPVKEQRNKTNERKLKMKLLFWITIISLIGIGLYFLGQANNKVYADCVAEGRMSDTTCYKLAYM